MDIEVIGYDVFDMLVNFGKFFYHNHKSCQRNFQDYPDDKTYKEVKILMSLDKTQENRLENRFYKRDNVISLSDLENLSYYFNHNTSYVPGYLGWGSSVYLQQISGNK